MKTPLSDLRTLRGRVFFWLGLAVLPVFWVWWMRPAYFSERQRKAGWAWTAIYVVLLIVFRDFLAMRWDHFTVSYPYVALSLGGALVAWLFLRIMTVLECLVLMMVTAKIGDNLMHPAIACSPWIFLFPGLVALAHLLVEPIRQQAARDHAHLARGR